MSHYPKIPYLPLVPLTPRQKLIVELLDPKYSIDTMYARLMADRPVPEVTIIANRMR